MELNSDKIDLINVYFYAKHAHDNKFRADGCTPYFEHIEEVVIMLKTWKIIDHEILATAYLHDVLEKTTTTEYSLLINFGGVITNLVKKITFDENIESEEVYFLRNKNNIVKLADHLTNTIWFIGNKIRNPNQYYNKGKILVDNFRDKLPYKDTIEAIETMLKN